MKKLLILSLCTAVLFTGTVQARDHDTGPPLAKTEMVKYEPTQIAQPVILTEGEAICIFPNFSFAPAVKESSELAVLVVDRYQVPRPWRSCSNLYASSSINCDKEERRIVAQSITARGTAGKITKQNQKVTEVQRE
jgi:hypothetical protein